MSIKSQVEIRFVTKSDGPTVPFDYGKLIRSIRRTLEEVEMNEYGLADDLANLVYICLAKEYPKGRVESAQIAELIQRVLKETGFPVASSKYELFRSRRDFIRSNIEVRVRIRQKDMFMDDANLGEYRAKWDKRRIYQFLCRRGMSPDFSSRIAKQVEDRVIAAGLRTISEDLIKELVDNELVTEAQELGISLSTQR